MNIDRAYMNGAFIAGADAYPPRWEAKAAAFRQGLGKRAETGIAYGSGARQAYDLFRPEGTARGLMVFIHGGYWIRFDRSMWSHLAAGALARGWACAMPSYTLAPEARIREMGQEMVTMLAHAGAAVPGPLVVTGHSAGGHLAARMACADIAVAGLRRVVPISPLTDLEPLSQTAMQAQLQLDAAEIASESPARLNLRTGVEAHIRVGGQERPAFLWHARLLAEEWNCDWSVAPGLHHFDVIDALEDPDSELTEILLGGF
ncbi:alpha/beta hydrolase [Szabonella alba]|uniref:Alpha/beta hydrolase n=1 Tax=Szabonella alba TaxID=2804194 RepID=A0A8K0V6B1_9RHOB|nr:alpha/beta hydrolase [Szabonella alba]MBL4916178.1 alpha/beta hydrolase [Szabonella alba]